MRQRAQIREFGVMLGNGRHLLGVMLGIWTRLLGLKGQPSTAQG